MFHPDEPAAKNIHESPPVSLADSLGFAAWSGKIQEHVSALSSADETRCFTSG
jgi:hypothetical protein